MILNLGVPSQNFTLAYELPASMEVDFTRAAGNQIALVYDGYLNEKQRFLFQTTVS